jgi:hypothetical protein
MVALPPITATSTLPGYARPVPVAQPGSAADGARGDGSGSIGGGAATSAIANQAKRALVEQSKEAADAESKNRPRAEIPSPPFAQSVGLYDNSTRVYVDIVLSSDQSRRVARVFGTPPATVPARGATESVNFVA